MPTKRFLINYTKLLSKRFTVYPFSVVVCFEFVHPYHNGKIGHQNKRFMTLKIHTKLTNASDYSMQKVLCLLMLNWRPLLKHRQQNNKSMTNSNPNNFVHKHRTLHVAKFRASIATAPSNARTNLLDSSLLLIHNIKRIMPLQLQSMPLSSHTFQHTKGIKQKLYSTFTQI